MQSASGIGLTGDPCRKHMRVRKKAKRFRVAADFPAQRRGIAKGNARSEGAQGEEVINISQKDKARLEQSFRTANEILQHDAQLCCQ